MNKPIAPDSNPTRSYGSVCRSSILRQVIVPSIGAYSFGLALEVGLNFPNCGFCASRPVVGSASINWNSSIPSHFSVRSHILGM